jgi:zinc transport system substrate-binding protein
MRKHTCLLFGIFLLLTLTANCSKQEMNKEKIRVVVSIPPLAEFVEKIGGDKVSVSVMVPPGASPHTYEPSPLQLVELGEARIYVKVGTPIDFELVWLDKILSVNKDMLVVDASKGVELMDMESGSGHADENAPHSGRFDPHIWLSPRNAKIMVDNIYKGLIKTDPADEDYYSVREKAYLQELDTLDRDIGEMLSGIKNRRFMVYHPAWGYFARDYNLEEIPVEAEGKEPTARDIQHLIGQAKKYDIKIIFVSPQFNIKSAEVIAREIKGRVIFIDPLNRDYISSLRKLTQELSENN